MKRIILVGCLFAIVSNCVGTAVDPKSNNNNDGIKKKVEHFAADFVRYKFAESKMKTAEQELHIAEKNQNYQISNRSQKILKKYNLLNDDGAIVEGASEAFAEISNKMNSQSDLVSFLIQHNIDLGSGDLP